MLRNKRHQSVPDYGKCFPGFSLIFQKPENRIPLLTLLFLPFLIPSHYISTHSFCCCGIWFGAGTQVSAICIAREHPCYLDSYIFIQQIFTYAQQNRSSWDIYVFSLDYPLS